ncbi:MAG: hypothetical protein RLY86_30 [Pseudomonadota bacterium]|jgi:type VI secretion system protein ImpC
MIIPSATADLPRVNIRVGSEGDAVSRDLPFVITLIGPFSGDRRITGLDKLVIRTAEPRSPGALFRSLLPMVTLSIPDPAGAIHQIDLVIEGLDGFEPAGIATAETFPALAVCTALRLGLMRILRRREGAADTPARLAEQVSDHISAIRTSLVTALAAMDDLTDLAAAGSHLATLPPWVGDPASLCDGVFRLTAWLDLAVLARARLAAERRQPRPPETAAGRLLSLSPATIAEEVLVPALWAGLTIGGPLPWAEMAREADGPLSLGLHLGSLFAAAEMTDLRQMLLGEAAPTSDHAAWLAGRLEARAEGLITRVIRAPAFIRTEACWRALAHLMRSAAGRGVEFRLLDLDEDQLAEDLQARGHVERSRLYDIIYNEGYGSHGSPPIGMLVCLFDVQTQAKHANLLGRLSVLGARAHCPVIAGVAPEVVERALDHMLVPDAVPEPAEHERWTSLRRSRGRTSTDLAAPGMADQDARMIALAGPHLLLRGRHRHRPHNPAPLRFKEPGAGRIDDLVWTSGSLAVAERAAAAHRRYGWPVAISGTGLDTGILDLPGIESYGDEPGSAARKLPVRIAVTEAGQVALQKLGIAAVTMLTARRRIALLTVPSLFAPDGLAIGLHGRDDAYREYLASRLPYALASARFSHCLKAMLRLQVGRGRSAADLTIMANQWLSQYIAWQPDAGLAIRAEKPLRRGNVTIIDIPGRPGFYEMRLELQPHFQVDHIGVDCVLPAEFSLTS